MVSRRWTVIGAGLIMVGVMTAQAIWRPRVSRPAPPFDIPAHEFPDLGALLDPDRLVTLTAINKAGGPCRITIMGSGPGAHMEFSFTLTTDETKQIQKTTGPLTIESIAVERGGTSHRQEMKVTIPAGQGREVRVDADDSVEVVAASP